MATKTEKKLKPVPRRTAEIVGELARGRVVEALIQNVTHHSTLDGNLRDLTQIIYFALLQTELARLEHLTTSGQMNYYIVRMITNQYFSENSPFYKEIRKFGRKTVEVSPQISESYEAGMEYR